MNIDILAEMNKYRKHPRFQLERHFDIFLIPYLPEIINTFYRTSYELAVPEFPVRKNLVSTKYKSKMESISIDFAVFDRKNRKIGFIELKTDNTSNNTIQDENMKYLGSNVKAEDVKLFIEERCDYKKNTLVTYKYNELKTFLVKENVYDCFQGNCSIYKITPTNELLKEDEYLSFGRIIESYINESQDWNEIRKYLKLWDERIK